MGVERTEKNVQRTLEASEKVSRRNYTVAYKFAEDLHRNRHSISTPHI